MNSVLQAITHVPAFAELCLRREPLPYREPANRSLTAYVQFHVKKALSCMGPAESVSGSLRPTAPFQPVPLARGLRSINKGFKQGRQEDAHEYLRCLLDFMHESHVACVQPKPSSDAQATTFIHKVFGGRTRSQIQCLGIKYESSLFEPFLDLSLQIFRCKTLQQALQNYTADELLDGDNKYRCPLNNKLVCAERSTRIQDPPNVLTIHLKRFEFAMFGKKVRRHVAFGAELDLSPYLHHTAAEGNHWYDLVSIVVHHGHSVSSGHYVAYVKSASGIWHLCDDQCVCRVKPDCVFKQQAYILMYSRRTARSWLLPRGAGGGGGGSAGATVGTTLRATAAAAQGGLRGGDAEAALLPSGSAHLDDSPRVPLATTSHPAAVAALPAADCDVADSCLPHERKEAAGVSPRNSRIPRTMARNLALNGRSAKNLNLLQASCMSTRKRLVVRRLLNQHIDEPRLPDAAAPAPGREWRGSCAAHHDVASNRAAAVERSVSTGARAVPGIDPLLRGPGRRQVAAIGTWDDVDKGAERQAQSLTAAARTKRHALNEYDEAYDRGRVKKLRQRRLSGVGAANLQAAQEARGVKALGGDGQARFGGKRRHGRIGGMRSGGGPSSG